MKAYLDRHLPSHIVQHVMTLCRTKELPPQHARRFCSFYKYNKSALDHFSVKDLIEDSDLWLMTTDEGRRRHGWLQDVYPKDIKAEMLSQPSLIQCRHCRKNTVDYFQKQTRGADEPMTCFCHCLSCGKRWKQ